MWIEKRTVNGKSRYKFIERYRSELTGKYRKVSVTYSKNNASVRKEAIFTLQQLIDKRLKNERSSTSDITLEDLSKKFLKLYKQQVAYTTYYSAKRGLKRFCNDMGNNVLAKKITTQMLNKYLDERLYNENKHLSNAGIQLVKKHISLMFKYAVKYGYLADDPVKNVEIAWRSETKEKREKIENKYFTDDEYKAIMTDCDQRNRQDMKDIFEWLFLTGMRFSEAAALQIKNIQIEDGNYVAKVTGSMFIYRKKDVPEGKKRYTKSDSAKTIAGNRTVILPDQAVKIYERNKAGKNADDFLFINSISGFPMRETAANRFLKRVAERQKIDKKFTTHMFRHTHVSKLAEMGIPLYVIQKRVGHSNSKITEQVYLHVTKKVQDNLIEKLNQLAPSVPPKDDNKND